jgi:hypothetical protein
LGEPEEALRRFRATDANFVGPMVQRSVAEPNGRHALLAGASRSATRLFEEAAALFSASSAKPSESHEGEIDRDDVAQARRRVAELDQP